MHRWAAGDVKSGPGDRVKVRLFGFAAETELHSRSWSLRLSTPRTKKCPREPRSAALRPAAARRGSSSRDFYYSEAVIQGGVTLALLSALASEAVFPLSKRARL